MSDLWLASLSCVCHDRCLHEANAHSQDDISDIEHSDGVAGAVQDPTNKKRQVHNYHTPLASKEFHYNTGHHAADWLTDEGDATWEEINKIIRIFLNTEMHSTINVT